MRSEGLRSAAHKHQTVTIHVFETTLAIELDGETRVARRTTTLLVRSIKADRPRMQGSSA